MADDRTPPAPVPTEHDVARVVERATGRRAATIRRFPTGLAHYVFDVVTDDGGSCVVRMTRPDLRRLYEGCLYWHGRLRPLGVPLPEILLVDDGAAVGFPAVVMERLAGDDLGVVYESLSAGQRRALAGRIVEIQRVVGGLPRGRGFGYAMTAEKTMLFSRWQDALADELARTRRRLAVAGLIDASIVDDVEAAAAAHAAYFSRIEPVPFLDDLTTKNVIVANGRLSGIVDVDMVCYGDSLRTPALTYVALTSLGYVRDYVESWLERLALAPGQRRALDIYVAMYCVDLLSEVGHRFNRDQPVRIDEVRVERLQALLRRQLDELGG